MALWVAKLFRDYGSRPKFHLSSEKIARPGSDAATWSSLSRICAVKFDDVPPTRRKIMGSIRGRDTRPERAIRSALHEAGYRFLTNAKGLPGRPDVAFTRRKVAIFVHGCFWHGHTGCDRWKFPATRAEFWREKLERNSRRDARTVAELEKIEWQCIVVWDCERSQPDFLKSLMHRLGPQRTIQLRPTYEASERNFR